MTPSRDEAPSASRLAAVIVNYRTPGLVAGCLESLSTEIDPAAERALVVDNASGDGSANAVRKTIADRNWGGWADVIDAPQNRGFSAGNNMGIAHVKAGAYLLLNSDTIVRPGALRFLREALEENPDIALFSPRLEWPDGTPQESIFRFMSPLSELLRGAGSAPVTRLFPRAVVARPVAEARTPFAWASFACIVIRAEVFADIGLMDEGFFMYFEDIDFCRRAHDAGWKSLHLPQARVVHLRGGSSPVKKLSAERKRRPRYFYASRSRYFAKHYGIAGLWLANGLWMLGRTIALAREIAGNKEPHACEREARDIWTNAFSPLRTEQQGGGEAA